MEEETIQRIGSKKRMEINVRRINNPHFPKWLIEGPLQFIV